MDYRRFTALVACAGLVVSVSACRQVDSSSDSAGGSQSSQSADSDSKDDASKDSGKDVSKDDEQSQDSSDDASSDSDESKDDDEQSDAVADCVPFDKLPFSVDTPFGSSEDVVSCAVEQSSDDAVKVPLSKDGKDVGYLEMSVDMDKSAGVFNVTVDGSGMSDDAEQVYTMFVFADEVNRAPTISSEDGSLSIERGGHVNWKSKSGYAVPGYGMVEVNEGVQNALLFRKL